MLFIALAVSCTANTPPLSTPQTVQFGKEESTDSGSPLPTIQPRPTRSFVADPSPTKVAMILPTSNALPMRTIVPATKEIAVNEEISTSQILTSEEVLAVIKDRMRTIHATKTSNAYCYQVIDRLSGWESFAVNYSGDHKWTIENDTWSWTYFERTGALAPEHPGSWSRRDC